MTVGSEYNAFVYSPAMKTLNLNTLLPACLLLVLLMAGPAFAQNPPSGSLFASDAPFSFTLAARMQDIVGDRVMPKNDSLAIKHPALLTYNTTLESASAGPAVGQIPLALVVRGNFRRDAKHCQFPPLYVDFPKKRTSGTPFVGQNTLKLVTHCQSDEFVVRESLVYTLYNVLTDLSFRTRLARITYVDSLKKRPAETRWGFLIEDEDDVARRNGMREYKGQTMLSDVDSISMATMAVFEYMIGNIDWVIGYRHNVKLMAVANSDDPPKVMPYDFDHAVIVGATYASRADETGQRIYRGPRYPGWLLKRVFARFVELKPRFYAIYESDKRLSGAYVKQTVKYLDTFYKNINDPATVKAHFFQGDTGGKLFASF
jgi:hypothetical protein